MTMLQSFEMPKLSPSRRIPKWALTGFYNEVTQEVFVPAVVAARSEMEALLMASWDGTPVVHDRGHLYVPTTWVAREWPDAAELMARVEANVREVYT